MKIAMHCTAFYPRMGGIESVADMISREVHQMGHEVRMITQTAPPPGGKAEDHARYSFPILRNPSFFEWVSAIRWADVYLQFNVALKGLLPWCLARRPLVISHHGWYSPATQNSRGFGRMNWTARMKRLVSQGFAENVSCSQAVADYLRIPTAIVPNPYRTDFFRERPEIPRDRDLVFLGRLVSDKGADLLLEAIHILAMEGLRPTLSFIGEGPEKSSLENQVEKLNLREQVTFEGSKSGEELGRSLNRFRVMVIPSRVLEGFGVVALEGIASGCIPVASDAGGLREAIGPAGAVFPMGDVKAIAQAIRSALSGAVSANRNKIAIENHLAKHTPQAAAAGYLAACERAVKNSSRVS